MTRTALVAAASIATLLVSSVVADAAFAAAASSSTPPATTAAAKPAKPAPVSLTCAVTSGDVSQTLTITNSTTATIAKNTKIRWVLGTHKGSQKLTADLAAGKTVTVRGPAGSIGTCTATYTPAK